MARLALGIVGAVAGYYISGGTPQGAQLGFAVGYAVGAVAFPDKIPDRIGPKLGDTRVSGATFGVPIPVVYGSYRIAGNMIWTSGIEEVAREEKIGGGFSGGGGTSTTFEYFASFAIGLCEGPIDQVQRIWADTKLIYDVSATDPVDSEFRFETVILNPTTQPFVPSADTATGNRPASLTVYYGSETQLPDPLIESVEGVGEVPAHRGLAYFVVEDMPLEDFGNRIPNFTAEVLTSSVAAYPEQHASASGTSFVNLVVDEKRNLVYRIADNSYVQKYDIQSNTILLENTPSYGDPIESSPATQSLDVDVDGYLYVPLEISFLVGTVARLDPGSLEVINTAFNFTGAPGSFSQPIAIKVTENFVFATTNLPYRIYVWTRIGAINPKDMEPYTQMYFVGVSSLNGVPGVSLTEQPHDYVWFTSAPLSGNGTCYLYRQEGQQASREVNLSAGMETYELPANYAQVRHCAYDRGTHSIILHGSDDVTGDYFLARFDIDTETITQEVPLATVLSSGNASSWHRGVVGRSLWTTDLVGNTVEINVDSLTLVRSLDRSDWDTSSGATIYDPVRHALIGNLDTGGFSVLFIDRQAPAPVTLASIVQDQSVRAGLDPSDIDVSVLTDSVHGYAITRRSTAAANVEPLRRAFLFDAVESDWIVKFYKRDGASIATIPAEDLGAHNPGEETPVPLTEALGDGLELPIRVDVRYADPAINYQDQVQHAQRFQDPFLTQNLETYELAIALTADQAKACAEAQLYGAWMEDVTYQFAMSRKWSTLDPGDVVTVSWDDVTHTIRLHQIDTGAAGVTLFEGVRHDAAVVAPSPLPGAVGILPVHGSDGPIVLTQVAYLDTPLLRDVDESRNLGFYVAVRPAAGGTWGGATLLSSPGGVTYSAQKSLDNQATMGSATTVLADKSVFVWDNLNTLTVRLASSSLSLASSTEAEVLLGANAALLGDEIIQYVNATQVDAITWTLDTLLRGRRGTEWATGTHALGDRFIALEASTIQRVDMGLSDVGVTRYWKAVTYGDTLEETPAVGFNNRARGAMPYAPHCVRGSRDASNNLTLVWYRRTRIGGERFWTTTEQVPLGEDTELYDIDVLSAPGGLVLRTLQSTSETVTYTAAQQTADGLTPGQAVSVEMYQISATVGRGFATATTA